MKRRHLSLIFTSLFIYTNVLVQPVVVQAGGAQRKLQYAKAKKDKDKSSREQSDRDSLRRDGDSFRDESIKDLPGLPQGVLDSIHTAKGSKEQYDDATQNAASVPTSIQDDRAQRELDSLDVHHATTSSGNMIKVWEKESAREKSGLVNSHIDAFKQEAIKNNYYLLFRPVNLLSTSLIEAGAATKGLNVHGKSSDWGPMAGYIPFDQDLSKKHSDQEAVQKGNRDNEHSLHHYGDIHKVPLQLSQKRVHELTEKNLLTVNDKGDVTINANVKGAQVYEFRLNEQNNHSFAVEYRVKSGQKTVLGESFDWRPIYVMGQEVDGVAKPLTADYDMFAICPKLEKLYKELSPQLRPIADYSKLSSKEKFKLMIKRLIGNMLVERRNEVDPQKGRRTSWQKKIMDTLNKAAQIAGYTGGNVINHGTEQDNVLFPEKDETIFIITPDRNEDVFTTKSWEDTQKFISKHITSRSYVFYPNRSYNFIAGFKDPFENDNDPTEKGVRRGSEVSINWADRIPTKREFNDTLNKIQNVTKTALLDPLLNQQIKYLKEDMHAYYTNADRYHNGEFKYGLYYWTNILKRLESDVLDNANIDFPNKLYKNYFSTLARSMRTQLTILLEKQKYTVDDLVAILKKGPAFQPEFWKVIGNGVNLNL